MVQGVGGTGSGGSLADLSVYQTYRPMYDEYKMENPNTSFTFEGWLTWKGYHKNFNQKAENYIETGKESVGDGKDQNNIGNKFVTNGNQAIYQTQDDDCYYEFDYENGTYRKIEGKQDIANALGIGDINFDTINFGHNSVNVTDYTFGGLDDGQDKTVSGVNGSRFGNITHTNQEFDIDYILNALLMDPTDPQYAIAKGVYDDLCKSTNQWLPQSATEELDEIAAEYGTDSAEYKTKLKEVLLANLDQAQEWVEGHTHVKKPTSSTELDAENNPNSSDKDNTTTETKPGTIPSYSIEKAISDAGASGVYSAGEWQGDREWDRDDGGKDGAKINALNEAKTYASNLLDGVMNSIRAQLGDNLTSEIDSYLYKAKTIALEANVFSTPDVGGACNLDIRAKVDVKTLVNTFNENFRALSTNNGKTNAEVEADKKAEEARKEKEKSGYQTIYNMNMKSLSGSTNNISVVNPGSAAEIKTKAENDVINPLIQKIKSQMSGKGVPDSDIETMLKNAATATLGDCTSWATTSNNSVYTIDTSKLIGIFQDNVKTIIKNKGYSF